MARFIKRFSIAALLLFFFIPASAQLVEKLKAAADEYGIKISGIKSLEPAENLKSLYLRSISFL